jgi:hypothetical protein
VVNLNVAGGSPTLALLVGSSTVQATYVSGAGSNTLVFTTTIASGQNDVDGIAIALNALSLNGAVLADAAGNTSTPTSAAVSSNSAYMVDTLAPSVSVAFNVASLKAGETATLTVTANDKTGTSFAWNGTSGDLTVTGGTLSTLSPFELCQHCHFHAHSWQHSSRSRVNSHSCLHRLGWQPRPSGYQCQCVHRHRRAHPHQHEHHWRQWHSEQYFECR